MLLPQLCWNVWSTESHRDTWAGSIYQNQSKLGKGNLWGHPVAQPKPTPHRKGTLRTAVAEPPWVQNERPMLDQAGRNFAGVLNCMLSQIVKYCFLDSVSFSTWSSPRSCSYSLCIMCTHFSKAVSVSVFTIRHHKVNVENAIWLLIIYENCCWA